MNFGNTTLHTAISIIIADDHTSFRQSLSHILSHQFQFRIISEAKNGNELQEKLLQYTPDVILLDISMPVCNGIDTCRIIRSKFPKLAIIGLSMHEDSSTINEMIAAGADAYLTKTTDIEELVLCISVTLQRLREVPLNTFSKCNPLVKETQDRKLSKREIEIITLICSQLSVKEIADSLSLSTYTIEDHVKSIKRKTSSRNWGGIVIYAIKNQIVNPYYASALADDKAR